MLQSELERRHPGGQVVGRYSPLFRCLTPSELESQDELIRRSGANITWVGLGTLAQDFEAQRLAQSVPEVAVAVAAAFDFVARTKKEAPNWMIRFGLEWTFRFISEPKRLWKRYLISNATFFWVILKRVHSS